MKYLNTLILAIVSLALGACAHEDSPTMQSHQTTTTSTGYSK